MMFHHYEFGYKGFSGSEDISRTTVIYILNVECDPDREHSSPIIIALDILAHDDLQSYVAREALLNNNNCPEVILCN